MLIHFDALLILQLQGHIPAESSFNIKHYEKTQMRFSFSSHENLRFTMQTQFPWTL